ncbi:LysE family translocator [Acinetobacter sp. TUM15064]|uniref:LysE family translocator n=1 Tax=Acinetobacter sp. TUM15064 TaxID=2609134 RepID=UPI00124CD1DC|nr:LysE family translocator [Acinetobacter sp. TUM15064]
MIDLSQMIAFAGVALLMVLTPGPNMIYLISRSISQGKSAGLISLAGIILGFIFYMACASLGITAFLFAVPFAYDTIKILGALYLLWLAWNAVKPNRVSAFQTVDLKPDRPMKLFMMGFLTNLLNPKIAIMYLSLLPQFIQPNHGSVFVQSMTLGLIQIVVSVFVNVLIVYSAGSLAALMNRKPIWAQVQKWMMGTVLSVLAVRLLMDERK